MKGREDHGGGESLARTILQLPPAKDGLSPHPLQGGVSRRPLRVPLIKGQQRALPSGDTGPASLLPPVCGDQGDPQGYHGLRTAERLPPLREITAPALLPLVPVRVCQSARQDGYQSPQGQFALCQTGWNGEGPRRVPGFGCKCSAPLLRWPPLSSALDIASPDPLGWAHRLSLPPSFGLMK